MINSPVAFNDPVDVPLMPRLRSFLLGTMV
jgi:hypothetical protein